MAAIAASAFATHKAHILIFGVPSALLFGWVAAKQVRGLIAPLGSRARYMLFASAGSLGVAAVHASVVSEHYHEAFIYGLFFTCAAAAQLCWPAIVLLTHHRRRWLLAGAFGNLAVIVLWAYTRIVGVPLGPGRGSTEAIGAADIVATCCEVLVVVCALLAARRQPARVVRDRRPSLARASSSMSAS
ncbi:MAG: hypothetical protein ACTHK4_05435 [Mycobacteriales bacterium]